MDLDSNFRSAWVTITHSVTNGKPITYGDLGSVLGLKPRSRQLGNLLKRIRDVCEARGWPDLTLAVVLATTRVPSPRRPGPVYHRETWVPEWTRITAWDWPASPPDLDGLLDNGRTVRLRLEVPRDMADAMTAELRRHELNYSETLLKAVTVPSVFEIEAGMQTVGTLVAAIYAAKAYYQKQRRARTADLAESAAVAGGLLGSDPSIREVVIKLPNGSEVRVSRNTQEETVTAIRKNVGHGGT